MFVFVAVAVAVAVAGEDVMVDLSHKIDRDIMVWPGGEMYKRKATKQGYQEPGGYWLESYDFCMAEHSGTHLDAPSHFAKDGWTVDRIPLSHLIAPGVVVDIQDKAAKDPLAQLTTDDLKAWLVKHGPLPDRAIVLVRTGWARRYGNKTAYFGNDTDDTSKFLFPGISVGAAQMLTAYKDVTGRRVVGVGLDTPSQDYGLSKLFPTHVQTASANIFGIENLADMSKLPATGFQLMVMPIKLKGGSGGPVRVIATFPDSASTSAAPSLLDLAVTHFLLAVAFFSLQM